LQDLENSARSQAKKKINVSYLLLVVSFLSNIDIQKPYIFVFESMAQVPQ